MRRLAPALLILGAAVAGCATSADPPAPAWVEEGAASAAAGYPDLGDVPREPIANTSGTYWRGVTADVAAARQDLLDNPRATYAPPEQDPVEFLEEAQGELAETRDSH